jgi:hypothetical protein
MKLGEAFPSKYLSAADVPDEGLAVTIDSYDLQDVGQGDRKKNKPVLHFRERDVKSLVLNKTNAKVIEQVTGSDDLDNWIGHKITLVPREVEFQGETVWAIRVQLPRRQANRAAVNAQSPVRSGKAGGPDAPPPPLTDEDIGF